MTYYLYIIKYFYIICLSKHSKANKEYVCAKCTIQQNEMTDKEFTNYIGVMFTPKISHFELIFVFHFELHYKINVSNFLHKTQLYLLCY